MRNVSREDVQQLYRAVADGESRGELLQRLYDIFGDSFDLRPPVSEMRLADRCRDDVAEACHG